MSRSLVLTVVLALCCLGAATAAYMAGRASAPNLSLAARSGNSSGMRMGSRAGSSAGHKAGFRTGYAAGYRHAYPLAYRTAYLRTVRH
jgi:hypothetical protein